MNQRDYLGRITNPWLCEPYNFRGGGHTHICRTRQGHRAEQPEGGNFFKVYIIPASGAIAVSMRDGKEVWLVWDITAKVSPKNQPDR